MARDKIIRLFNPEQERSERIARIKELLKSDLSSPDIVGYHGFSIQALQRLIDRGSLPGTTVEKHKGLGTIFYYPANPDAAENKKSLDGSVGYAARISEDHAALTRLGMPIDDPEFKDLIIELWRPELKESDRSVFVSSGWDPELKRIFDRSGKTDAELFDALLAGREHKGFVAGISKRVLQDFTVTEGDDKFILLDKKVLSNNGLDLQYMAGLRAMGPKEKEYIESLKI